MATGKAAAPEPQETTGPATIADLAKLVAEVNAELRAEVEAKLAEIAKTQAPALDAKAISKAVSEAMAEALTEAGGGITRAVAAELHILGARVEGLETGISRSIGRAISGPTAALEEGQEPVLPSQRFAGIIPGAGEGPEVAAGLGT